MDAAGQPDGRGHLADTPEQIPKAGWWSILRRVYSSVNEKNLSIIAAGVAFYGMLSIFPALAALIAVYGIIADPATVQRQISAIHGLIPAEAQNVIAAYLKHLVSGNSSKLGIGLVVSLLIALWSARAGTSSMIQALNVVYEEKEKRNFVWYQVVALAMTVAAILFAIVVLSLIAAIPAMVELVPLPHSFKIIGAIVPWPILIILVSIALAAVYRFAPSRREAKWRWVSWGGGFATLLWIVASAAFSIYVAKFGDYDKSFGSLGAVVVLMMWFYISAYMVLIGASLNAEMERQTARDTTRGPEKPLGRRGARMADSIASDTAAGY